jgi:hypothetical protein
MKKLILSLFAVALLASTGCKSGGASSSDPKVTLINFITALSKKDIAGAKKLATKESESMFSMMEMGLKMAENMKKDEADDEFSKFNPDKMEFGEAKIDGDKATVPVTNKDEKETVNFILKKESGAWKVAFDKASMMEMGGEKMREKGMEDGGSDSLNFNTDEMKKGLEMADSLLKNMDPKKLEELQKAAENLKNMQ